jgi:hypothetical protein
MRELDGEVLLVMRLFEHFENRLLCKYEKYNTTKNKTKQIKSNQIKTNQNKKYKSKQGATQDKTRQNSKNT